MATEGLKRQAARGAKWTAASAVFGVAARAVVIVVAARLLGPEEIGLYGICVLVVGFAQIFMETGFGSSAVHFQDATRRQLSTLYWLNVLVGVAMTLAVVAAAPLLAPVFGQPALAHLLPICAAAIVIHAVGQPFQYQLQRDMALERISAAEVAASLVNAVVTIGLAALGWGLYALIAGFVVFALVRSGCLFGFGIRRWRPALALDPADARAMIRFGVYHMGTGLMNYLRARSGALAVSLTLGTEAMGYFVLAQDIVNRPVVRLGPIVNRVLFPTLAKVQGSPERLRRGYRFVVKLLMLAGAPALLGFMAIAEGVVLVALGATWLPAVPVIQGFCALSLCQLLLLPNAPLMLALGKARRAFAFAAIQAAIHLPVALVAFRYGGLELGMAIYAGLHAVQVLAAFHFVVRPLGGIEAAGYLRDTLPPLGAALLMALAVAALPAAVELATIPLLAAQMALGLALYGGFVLLAERRYLAEVLALAGGR
jgi:O-antigen/teichoic acid export membrane protein